MYSVYGIDVSKYQGGIQWDLVKNDGIRFAAIKATEGSWRQDNSFEKNRLVAKKNKIIR